MGNHNKLNLANSVWCASRRGLAMLELVIALAIIATALIPLAYGFTSEQRALRASYYRAVAMQVVDGEMEILAAGEWKAFKEGVQPYPVRAESTKNLPPGKFTLTIADKKLRLEWKPDRRSMGGGVVREVAVK
jgi:hypothetical protein